MAHSRSLSPLVLALAAGCVAALANAAIADQPDKQVLSGPKIADKPAGLFEMGLDGSMVGPEIPIAEAVLKGMSLDTASRERVNEFLAGRAAVMDAIVKENLETLNTMRTEREAGGPEVRARHMRAIEQMFAPVLEEGPLERQLASLLPEGDRQAYLDRIREHRMMLLSRARAQRGEGRGQGFGGPPDDSPMLFDDEFLPGPGEGRGPRGPRAGGPDGEGRPGFGPGEGRPRFEPGEGRFGARPFVMQDFQVEIRRSIERVTGERRSRIDEVVSSLGLSPEQEGKVRAIIRDHSAKIRESENPRLARMEMMRALQAELTPEQRQTLRERMGGPDNRPVQRRGGPGRPGADD